MGRITVDATWQSKLLTCSEPVEVADEAGRTLGHYLPADHYMKLLYRLAEKQCPYSSAELGEMRKEQGGSSLADFWQTMRPTNSCS